MVNFKFGVIYGQSEGIEGKVLEFKEGKYRTLSTFPIFRKSSYINEITRLNRKYGKYSSFA